MKDLNQELEEIKNQSLQAFKDEFGDAFEESKEEIDSFVKESEVKAKEWGAALITGDLSKEGFMFLIDAQKKLFEAKLIKIAGKKQIKADNLKDKLISILIDKLTSLAE